jgi:hypothetical protein
MPYWRVGRATTGSTGTRGLRNQCAYLDAPAFHPERYTMMLDYTPSEFSRIRLQYGQSKTQAGGPTISYSCNTS